MTNSSLVIDQLFHDMHNGERRDCLAYVYCDYRDEAQQTTVNLMGALLKQTLTAQRNYLQEESEEILKVLKR
jgi:hypothetical protein